MLTLVNALYLKVSWERCSTDGTDEDHDFTRLDGSTVAVPLMVGNPTAPPGDGWVGASKRYVGGLAVQFVLPDEGRFDEVAAASATRSPCSPRTARRRLAVGPTVRDPPPAGALRRP